jgi:hypothetical protein
METCTEHESIPPAHLLPGMCPTSRWHSVCQGQRTRCRCCCCTTAAVACAACCCLPPCCGCCCCSAAAGACAAWCCLPRCCGCCCLWVHKNLAASTNKCCCLPPCYGCCCRRGIEVLLPGSTSMQERKEHAPPTEESKDSHDERCFETTVFPHHCGTTAAKVPSSYAHSIARCRTAFGDVQSSEDTDEGTWMMRDQRRTTLPTRTEKGT